MKEFKFCGEMTEYVEIPVMVCETQKEMVKEISEIRDVLTFVDEARENLLDTAVSNEEETSVYIIYKDGSVYFKTLDEEEGKFKRYGIKAAVIETAFEYTVYGDFAVTDNGDISIEESDIEEYGVYNGQYDVKEEPEAAETAEEAEQEETKMKKYYFASGIRGIVGEYSGNIIGAKAKAQKLAEQLDEEITIFVRSNKEIDYSSINTGDGMWNIINDYCYYFDKVCPEATAETVESVETKEKITMTKAEKIFETLTEDCETFIKEHTDFENTLTFSHRYFDEYNACVRTYNAVLKLVEKRYKDIVRKIKLGVWTTEDAHLPVLVNDAVKRTVEDAKMMEQKFQKELKEIHATFEETEENDEVTTVESVEETTVSETETVETEVAEKFIIYVSDDDLNVFCAKVFVGTVKELDDECDRIIAETNCEEYLHVLCYTDKRWEWVQKHYNQVSKSALSVVVRKTETAEQETELNAEVAEVEAEQTAEPETFSYEFNEIHKITISKINNVYVEEFFEKMGGSYVKLGEEAWGCIEDIEEYYGIKINRNVQTDTEESESESEPTDDSNTVETYQGNINVLIVADIANTFEMITHTGYFDTS